MQENVFKEKVEQFLLKDPKNQVSQVELDTHLWDTGLVDSFRMVELIMFLEDLLSKEININSNFTSNFHTIRKMYNALVVDQNN
jgi:acyl carrier protein